MLIPLPEKGYFTCSRYNWEKGQCNRYLERPKMCRDYPEYGGKRKCVHGACGGVHGTKLLSCAKLSTKG
jgi:Fe-S-cluster containining protein